MYLLTLGAGTEAGRAIVADELVPSAEEKTAQPPSRVTWIIFAIIIGFCFGMAIRLEIANRQRTGGALQTYHREYSGGGGSMKWRGTFGNWFHGRVLLPSVLVYPAALLAVVQAIYLAVRTSSKVKRAALAVAVVLLVGVLVRFVSLGVFSAALELG